MSGRTIKPYYESHKPDLEAIVEKYRRLERQTVLEGLDDPTLSHLLTAETAFRHDFRPYQTDSLYVLNELFGIIQDDRALKGRSRRKELIADLIEPVGHKQVPFLGFEMATGSGKTLVMGASVYLLAQRFGVRNFLILVGGPASSNIYQKTIRNFTHGHQTCVWDNRDLFPFRLITGENYRDAQTGLGFEKPSDVNVFVFNIQKFTETSGQTGAKTMRTQKPWETAPWKDKYGNTISLHEYLRSERLVIITDEAHHTQGTASQNIIKGFDPEAVLEFTATADETGGGNRRAQDIVFKYDIRQFLDDGYGKLIRALALDNDAQTETDDLDDYEKRKIITALLVHLVKREAVLRDLKSVIRKAVCLIKVKDSIVTANRVMQYIKMELAQDSFNLKWVVEKAISQKLEILDRFQELWLGKFRRNFNFLSDELDKIAHTAIGVYGEPDKETRRAFDTISDNNVEVVVYIKMLDEGIDLPHIYTMAVVKDNATNLVTSIKQIIGRGIRLNKEKRIYDGTSDQWHSQSELLHVVCDRGAAFESVIAAVQSEFGLTDRHIVIERGGTAKTLNPVKRHLLEKRYWPQLKADLVVRENTKLLDLLNDVETIQSDFISANCFYKGDAADVPILKFKPLAFFVEVDIFSDPTVYRTQLLDAGARVSEIASDEPLWQEIFGRTIRLQTTIPDIKPVRDIFRRYMHRFTEERIGYFHLDDADHIQARKQFAASFSYFLSNYIEKRYYRLDIGSLDEQSRRPLVNCFQDGDICLPPNINELWAKLSESSVVKDMLKSGAPFRGYSNNAYEYVTYDSLLEKRTGDIVNHHLDSFIAERDARPVWIKNNRQVSLSYGKRHYYPDFLICVGEKMYIIETKGDIYSDYRKNQLLREVELKTDGHVKPVLAFGDWIDRFGGDHASLDEFIYAAENDSTRRTQTWELEYTPPEEEKYKNYIPAYSPEKAWRRFTKGKTDIRPDGWAKLDRVSPRIYSDSCFAVQNRSEHLEYLGPWLVVEAARKPETGQNSLIRYSEFDDSYRRGFSVRRCKVYQEQTGGLFNQEVWEMTTGTSAGTIRLRPPTNQFDIIGTVIE